MLLGSKKPNKKHASAYPTLSLFCEESLNVIVYVYIFLHTCEWLMALHNTQCIWFVLNAHQHSDMCQNEKKDLGAVSNPVTNNSKGLSSRTV